MSAKIISFVSDFQVAQFLSDSGMSVHDIHVFKNNSGQISVLYDETTPTSLVEGATASARKAYDSVKTDFLMNATQVTASGGRTLTFAATGGTITASSGDFTGESFHPGMTLTVAGTTSNNGDYTIDSVTATVITVSSSDTLVDEGPLSATATLDAAQAGFDTSGARYAHIIINLPDGSTSVEWSLYLYNDVSELWCLDTRLGTGGVVALADTDTDNPQCSIVEIVGVSKIAIVFDTMTGTFTSGIDAWLSASTF